MGVLFFIFFPHYVGNVSSFTLSVGDYPPGDYNLTIAATDVFGNSVTEVVPLFLSGMIETSIGRSYIKILPGRNQRIADEHGLGRICDLINPYHS